MTVHKIEGAIEITSLIPRHMLALHKIENCLIKSGLDRNSFSVAELCFSDDSYTLYFSILQI